MATTITVNDEVRQINADENTPLLWVLRDELRLTGTKYGCGVAQCGACTVQINGNAVRACVTPLKAVAGKRVTTIEGVDDNVAKAVQAAWVELNVAQCGYCQSGQIISATTLLQKIANPTEKDIDLGMVGNICRCATYPRIKAAIQLAASNLDRKRQTQEQETMAMHEAQGIFNPATNAITAFNSFTANQTNQANQEG